MKQYKTNHYSLFKPSQTKFSPVTAVLAFSKYLHLITKNVRKIVNTKRINKGKLIYRVKLWRVRCSLLAVRSSLLAL
jgi:hypothetical protein